MRVLLTQLSRDRLRDAADNIAAFRMHESYLHVTSKQNDAGSVVFLLTLRKCQQDHCPSIKTRTTHPQSNQWLLIYDPPVTSAKQTVAGPNIP